MLSFAYPLIGDRDIKEMMPADVLAALRKVERRGRHETARRLRSTIGSVSVMPWPWRGLTMIRRLRFVVR
jgi:hypothetical protein